MDTNFEDWADVLEDSYDEEPKGETEEDPFADKDFFEFANTPGYVNKYQIFEGKLDSINHYGIYNYFKYCDTVSRLKMVADIHDGLYVINTADGYRNDHYQMDQDIRSRFGPCNCGLGSIGDEVNVFADRQLTVDQFDSLIGIFSELRQYYLDTNRNKKILFIGASFGNRLDNFKDCSNIDELIEALTMLRQEAVLNQSSFSECKFIGDDEGEDEMASQMEEDSCVKTH